MAVNNTKRQRLSAIDTRKVIESWFMEHHLNNPERLRQSKTWQIIKKYMTMMGHYKAKARGRPDKDIQYRLGTWDS